MVYMTRAAHPSPHPDFERIVFQLNALFNEQHGRACPSYLSITPCMLFPPFPAATWMASMFFLLIDSGSCFIARFNSSPRCTSWLLNMSLDQLQPLQIWHEQSSCFLLDLLAFLKASVSLQCPAHSAFSLVHHFWYDNSTFRGHPRFQ